MRVYGCRKKSQKAGGCWMVQGRMGCCAGSLNVQKAWSNNSRLVNPDACSLLLLPMTPQSAFISTVEALLGISTTVATRLLDGCGTFSVRLSRPQETPVTLTCTRTIHRSEGRSPSRAFTALPMALGFSAMGLAGSPAHTAPSSPSPHVTLWAGTGQALPQH